MADWFRNTTWSEAIEAEFLRRLSRARSQRDRYIVIQAVTLAQERPDVTVRLVDLYFNTRSDTLDDVRALWAKAQALTAMGDLLTAAETYRSVLAQEKRKPYYKTLAYLDYPFMVATKRGESEYENALCVLEDRRSDVAFPVGRFQWSAAYALILSALGRSDKARPYAVAAVAAAHEQSSEFQKHRELGLVGPKYASLIGRLVELSA